MNKQTMIKALKHTYIKKLIPAVFFLIFSGLIISIYPFQDILFPKHVDSIESLFDEYESGREFLEVSIPSLHYTGYDAMKNSTKRGSYYYSFIDETCVFFLLSSKTANPPATVLKNITITTKRVDDFVQLDSLKENFNSSLSWSKEDLGNISYDYLVSEPDAFDLRTYLLLGFLGITNLYASFVVLSSFVSLGSSLKSKNLY